MPIRLSAVISTVSVLLVVTVAIVTLTITLTSGLAALRSIAHGYAESLLLLATQRTEAIFTNVGIGGATFTNVTSSQRWPWPSDDPATVDTFTNLALQYTMSTIPSGATAIAIYFWDNTRITFERYNATSLICINTIPTSYSAAGGNVSLQTLSRTAQHFYDMTRGAFMTTVPYTRDATTDFRFRTTPFVNTLLAGTFNGMASALAGYYVRSNNDSRGVYTVKYVAMAQPLYRALDKPGVANLFGIVLTGFKIDDISAFLEQTRVTSGTQAFALDLGGYLLGSSMSAEAPFFTESIVPLGSTAGLGCAVAESAGSLSTGPNTKVCRTRYTQYPFAPLAGLDDTTVFATQPTVTIVGSYYVAVGPVKLPYPGMQIFIVLLMPEEDVIGDVVASRNVAIGITAGLVVLAGAINFLVVWMLLSPLGTIAERMVKASNFEDDGEDNTLSSMSEVCALQNAYYAMNEELNRIRSFVPQSVLQAKKKVDPSVSDDDADLESLKASGNRHEGDGPHSNSVSFVDGSGGGDATSPTTPARLRVNTSQPLFQRTSSQSDTGSVSTRHRGGTSKQLNAAAALKFANVTVLVVNFTRFSTAFNSQSREGQMDKIAATVAMIFDAVKTSGGVLASFHGDHFVVTFNAVTHCATHAVNACAAAVKIRDAASRIGFGLEPRMGIATGRCSIGNAGSAEAKAFCVVGSAYQQATVLERLVKVYSVVGSGALLSYRTCLDVATQYRVRYVDIVMLPGGERSACTRTLIAFLRNSKSAQSTTLQQQQSGGDHQRLPGTAGESADNEWLYLVADGDKDDEFGVDNEAFVSLYQGRRSVARELLDHADSVAAAAKHLAVTPEKDTSQRRASFGSDVRSRLTDLARSKAGPEVTHVVTHLGEFYDRAYSVV